MINIDLRHACFPRQDKIAENTADPIARVNATPEESLVMRITAKL